MISSEDVCDILTNFLPYGVMESWDDLNPILYLSVHIFWLKFYGMWYIDNKSRNLKYWLNILYTIIVFFLVCILPGLGEIIYLLRRRESISRIAEGLYLFLSEMYTYVKIIVFWCNRNKILKLIDFMNCPEFVPLEIEHGNIIKKTIRTSRFVMTAYTSMCVGAVSVGILMPFAENFIILPTNVEYPYIDVYKSPTYGVLFLHHVYYKPATCIIDGAMDTILAAFLASAIGQIEILSFNLRNFNVLAERDRRTDTNIFVRLKKNYVRRFLKRCIKHHNAIIKYVAMIEDAFSLASALQFMLSVMVLCLVGIQFLSIENPAAHFMQIMWMAVYLTCMLTEVFILCWFGNKLILKSYELQNAAFNSPWVEADGETRRFIIIFMERCKRPLTVTAGKYFTLSLTTYTKLINWSYKAFTVMSSTKSNIYLSDDHN